MKKIDYFKLASEGMENMLNMEKYFHTKTSIDPIIQELIKTRVSQINGCAFCLNMHMRDALKLGETAQRMVLLNAWRETRLFNEKEKVALELAERLTLITSHEIDEDLVHEVLKHFTEKEFVDLILMTTQINSWNRINIAVHNDID